MIVFPAIDLRAGQCVRLRQGNPAAQTIFSTDPAAMARRWVAAGARWLHVVNLDGAFSNSLTAGTALPVNLYRLKEIRAAVQVPIQFGGGLRSVSDIDIALLLGASRVILGSVALHDPEVVRQALDRFGPERIIVGIDARDGYVATHGWSQTSRVTAGELAAAMQQAGVIRAVYTDIRRDGMLQGVDIAGSVRLAKQSGLKIIASGGVSSADDVRRLAAREQDGIEGVIIGQALYTGAISLPEAMRAAGLDISES